MNTSYPTNYNIPSVVDAIAKIQKLYQTCTTLDANGGAYENAANNFFSENVAMICNGPWMIGDFSDTSKTTEGFSDKVGVATYPGGFVYDAPIEGMFVTKQSDPALEEAGIAMVKFFTSPKAQQTALETPGHGSRRCHRGNHPDRTGRVSPCWLTSWSRLPSAKSAATL